MDNKNVQNIFNRKIKGTKLFVMGFEIILAGQLITNYSYKNLIFTLIMMIIFFIAGSYYINKYKKSLIESKYKGREILINYSKYEKNYRFIFIPYVSIFTVITFLLYALINNIYLLLSMLIILIISSILIYNKYLKRYDII